MVENPYKFVDVREMSMRAVMGREREGVPNNSCW